MSDFFIYLILLAGSTYLIRAVPFVAIKSRIKNPFINSFLLYIPIAVLCAMVIPDALLVTESPLAAAVGLAVAVALAYFGRGLTTVALTGCIAAWICQILVNSLG